MKTSKRFQAIIVAALAAGQLTMTHAHGPRFNLSSFDLDDNGAITKEEFAAVSATLGTELQEKFLTKYDGIPQGQTVGDAIITPSESSAVHQEIAADWLDHLLEVFDTNDDGAISDADRSRFGRHGVHSYLLADADTDDDGIISAKELDALVQAKVQDLQERFLNKFDSIPQGATAGDGTITKEESLAAHQAIVQERVASILDRYDSNDDGGLTVEEIEAVNEGRPHRFRDGPRGGGHH